MFVRVAVNIPSEKTFSYAVPEKFEKVLPSVSGCLFLWQEAVDRLHPRCHGFVNIRKHQGNY